MCGKRIHQILQKQQSKIVRAETLNLELSTPKYNVYTDNKLKKKIKSYLKLL